MQKRLLKSKKDFLKRKKTFFKAKKLQDLLRLVRTKTSEARLRPVCFKNFWSQILADTDSHTHTHTGFTVI